MRPPSLALRLRSLGVSLASTALDLGLFALLSLVLVGARGLVLARWVCGALGAAANFLANRRFAFRASAEPWARQAGRFAVTAAVAVSLATLLWWALWRWTGWDPRLLHPMSLAAIWLLFTFPAMRVWVFRAVPRAGRV
ncbi:MAG TPA: GtrA family protein [Myxococcota bacterium]|nr:GtrA family protein [Myxococcota bacterium]HRY94962.1 GtrA family protein [Myxococcota bacterium]HSA19975.1 GtrA family protein [Myxococcota bacterium]